MAKSKDRGKTDEKFGRWTDARIDKWTDAEGNEGNREREDEKDNRPLTSGYSPNVGFFILLVKPLSNSCSEDFGFSYDMNE